ncbi:MAG: HAMP domain-containing sensor histidine kinase [Candidatus Xenobia bacterium]
MPDPPPLASRIRLLFMLSILGVVGIIGALMLQQSLGLAMNVKRSQLQNTATLLQRMYEAGNRQLVIPEASDLPVRVTIIDPGGRVLEDTHRDPNAMENHLSRPEVQAALRGAEGHDERTSRTLNRPMLYEALPLHGADGKVSAVLRVAVPYDAVLTLERRLMRFVAVSLLVALLCALLLAQRVSRSLSRPLERLTETVQHADAATELREEGPREVVRLARTLNAMRQELRRQYQAKQEEHERLESILAGLEDGVVVGDPEGRIVYANPSARALLTPEQAPAVDLQAAFQQPGEIRDLIRLPDSDRHLTLRTFDLADGRVAVVHDVTDDVRVDRMRRTFVANASHELRTPVAAIAAALEALSLGAKDDPQSLEAFLNRASREADRLRKLAEDLLDLAAAEEPLTEASGSCDAAQVAREVVERFTPAAAGRGQTLALSLDQEAMSASIRAEDLSRALSSVIDNAIKYTPEHGRITVEAHQSGDCVELVVTDSGPGIPPKYLHRIFERFFRIEKGRSRAAGGAGLGLSIARHLVERCGGSIGAQNAHGGGSRFRIRLPHP